MNLKTTLAGVKLKNPTMNASGVVFTMPPLLYALQEWGAGAAVTKSTTKESRDGTNGPTVIYPSKESCMNRMGLPNPGIEESVEELKKYKWEIPLIYSIAGSSTMEYLENSIKAAEIADILEINLSCPNVEGGTIGFDFSQTFNIMRSIRESVDIPIFGKLSPYTDIEKLKKTIDSLYKCEANGVTLTNTAPALDIISIYINVNERQSNNLFKGGLSSTALFPISLRNVYEASKHIDKYDLEMDIIGCGGIKTYAEVLKYVFCGAKAIQFGSAAAKHYDHHKEIPKALCKGIEDYFSEVKIDGKSIKSLEEVRGWAYK